MPAPLAIILISTNGHADFLAPCLQSIHRYCGNSVGQIVIVDNDGEAATTAVAQTWQDRLLIRILNQPVPKGFAANFNDAFQLTSEPHVLLLNVDTRFSCDVLTPLLETLQERPQLGALTIRLKGFDDKPQSSARAFPTPLVLFWEQIGVARLFPKSRLFGRYRLYYASQKELTLVDWISGAFMLCRRRAVEDVDGMCTDYFLYGEDTDFCRKLWSAGWQVAISPDHFVYHAKDPIGRGRRKENFWLTHRNLMLFWLKDEKRINYYLVRLVLAIGICIRILTLPLHLAKGWQFTKDSAVVYLKVLILAVTGLK